MCDSRNELREAVALIALCRAQVLGVQVTLLQAGQDMPLLVKHCCKHCEVGIIGIMLDDMQDVSMKHQSLGKPQQVETCEKACWEALREQWPVERPGRLLAASRGLPATQLSPLSPHGA